MEEQTNLPKWLAEKNNPKLTPRQKQIRDSQKRSKIQEKSAAKRFGGRTTIASGALEFDKADVVFKNFRLECKRTDKDGIWIDNAWLDKLERETMVRDDFALEAEVGDRRVYVIPESLFRFLEWSLTTPKDEIIKALEDGEYTIKNARR